MTLQIFLRVFLALLVNREACWQTGTYVGHRLWKLEHPQVWLHPTVSPREGWDDLFGGTTLQSGTLAGPEHRTAEPQTGPMALGWEHGGRERKVTSIRAGWEAGG